MSEYRTHNTVTKDYDQGCSLEYRENPRKVGINFISSVDPSYAQPLRSLLGPARSSPGDFSSHTATECDGATFSKEQTSVNHFDILSHSAKCKEE